MSPRAVTAAGGGGPDAAQGEDHVQANGLFLLLDAFEQGRDGRKPDRAQGAGGQMPPAFPRFGQDPDEAPNRLGKMGLQTREDIGRPDILAFKSPLQEEQEFGLFLKQCFQRQLLQIVVILLLEYAFGLQPFLEGGFLGSQSRVEHRQEKAGPNAPHCRDREASLA